MADGVDRRHPAAESPAGTQPAQPSDIVAAATGLAGTGPRPPLSGPAAP